jgi:hypothetical protein
MAVGPSLTNYELAVRVLAGRLTRCWGKIQRNRENRDHTDHHTQQLRTVLASHSHHLPPCGFRVGFSEPTAFYVTKRPSGRPFERHFYYTVNCIFCQFSPAKLSLTIERRMDIIKTEGRCTWQLARQVNQLELLTARGLPGGQHAVGAKYSAIERTAITQITTRSSCARCLHPIRITSPRLDSAWGLVSQPPFM